MVHQTVLVILKCFTLLCFLLLAVAANNNSSASNQIRLDCGAASTQPGLDSDNRTWDSDNDSKFAPSLKGVMATASYRDLSLPSRVPYMSARVFTSNYTYSFLISPGRIFVRLYFYPNTCGTYTPANGFFGVTAGNLTLLDNFSAFENALATNSPFFFREYSINTTSKKLDLTFAPSTHQTGTYAFINGIEIVPTPDLFTTPTPTIANGGNPDPFPIDPSWGFQTIYRINVGGPHISPQGDVDFYRTWEDDMNYIYGKGVTFGKDSNVTIEYTARVPKYTAPADVYALARSMGTNTRLNMKYNLTWIFTIDVEAYYILRFHFCEIQYPITKMNQRTFFIYINNQIAQKQMDVIERSNGIGRTVYMDYVVLTTGSGISDLSVAVHPDLSTHPEYYDAMLNGLEIFKIQNLANNSFYGLSLPLPLPNVGPSDTPGGRKSKVAVTVAVRVGVGGSALVLLTTCIGLCIICRRKKVMEGGSRTLSYAPMMHQTLLVILRCLTLSCLMFLAMAADNNSTASSQIRLDCGASTPPGLDSDNRTWASDTDSKFAPSLKGIPITASYQDPGLLYKVPYMTARVFTTNYTYSFPVSSGRIFVRLYFYPNTYGTYNPANGYFGVKAGNLTLLDDFNASQNALATNVSFFFREYSINTTSGMLDLTFAPSTLHNSCYAFINGIEIIPTPDLFSTPTPTIANGGNPNPFPIDASWGFQTMYRLNVGGQYISPHGDIDFYRTWEDDTTYIYSAGYGVTFGKDSNVTIEYTASVPKYTAPIDVYASARSMGTNAQINLNYNLTWSFKVDAGAYYLLRFHFCEIQYPITKSNQRMFFIYINNQTAQQEMDVIAQSNGIGRTAYKDYAVLTTGSGQVDLWVALHPDLSTQPEYYDAILNGLEIFKIQNLATNSLAGPNPPIPLPNIGPNETPRGRKSKGAASVAIGVGIGGSALILIACIGLCIICRRKKVAKDSVKFDDGRWTPLTDYSKSQSKTSGKTTASGSRTSTLPSNLCRHFSFGEIQTATNNFDQAFLLGKGGFGNVYVGEIDSGTKVAIKRGNPMSEQGVHEFQTEIEMLSKLRHRHLVSLIGYCDDMNEMILVYDFMAHGTLREHLYNTKNPPLSWRQRLEICIGAAQGLHYLHTGAKQTIIHRDVKTTNILLDEKWIAKVSDFGLSKTGPNFDNTHVSTVVKGSFGYLDPEYFRRQQLTEKSDVYSFGVVLFEVLCARPALNPSLPKEQISLADWALHCQKKGTLGQIIDPLLQGKIAPQCFTKYVETAEKCVADHSIDRPSMGDVLWNLEFALQLQESAEDSSNLTERTSSNASPLIVPRLHSTEPPTDTSTTTSTTMSLTGRSITSTDSDGLTPSSVFSQLMNTGGR